ncbi:SGNH/GDSL hydrolase family protein [Faunimonas sp. B44]|uniref:SGNH/GDSL hydrolase family protein n=1 Tax=Faunimonas sp. B44 TaxID=3461493 RepID=UPI004044C210
MSELHITARAGTFGCAARRVIVALAVGLVLQTAAPESGFAAPACPSLQAGTLAANAAVGDPDAAAGAAVALPSLAHRLDEPQPIEILAIGSSSTEGVGASSPAFSYPAQLQGALREIWKRSDVTVLNAGIGGEIAARAVERLTAALADRPIALVIWQVGTNDILQGVDEAAFRDELERGVSVVRAAKADLLLFDPQFFTRIRDFARFERFNAAIAETASARHVPLFSRYAFMKEANLRTPETLGAMLSRDGMHMSDFGYACIADRLADAIRTLTGPARVASAEALVPMANLAGAEAVPH